MTSCRFELDCLSENNRLCSGKDNLSLYKQLNTSINPNDTLAYVLSEEYAIEEEGSGVALERADYFECRYFDSVMNNNSNNQSIY